MEKWQTHHGGCEYDLGWDERWQDWIPDNENGGIYGSKQYRKVIRTRKTRERSEAEDEIRDSGRVRKNGIRKDPTEEGWNAIKSK